MLAPLRHRNFRLLFLGRVVSFAGSAMAPVALAFAVLGLGGSTTDLGLVLALAILPQVFFLLVGRGDRRPDPPSSRDGRVEPRRRSRPGRRGRPPHLGPRRDLAARGGRVRPRSRELVLLPGPAGDRAADGPGRRAPARERAAAAGAQRDEHRRRRARRPARRRRRPRLGDRLRRAHVRRRRGDPAADARSPPEREAATSFVHELRDGWREFRSRRWIWIVVLGVAFANAAQSAGMQHPRPGRREAVPRRRVRLGARPRRDRCRARDRQPDRAPDPPRAAALRRRRRRLPLLFPPLVLLADRRTLAGDRPRQRSSQVSLLLCRDDGTRGADLVGRVQVPLPRGGGAPRRDGAPRRGGAPEPDAEPDRRARRRRARDGGRRSTRRSRRSATTSAATWRSRPTHDPPPSPHWLRDRGLEPGWGWMSFRRGVDPLPMPSTSLRLVRVGRAEAMAFGRIVATGYGLPEAVVPWAAQAHAIGWDCWLALDGDEPAAAAGVFVAEGVGYLGFAATLPEHRGKGGQNALLARRIEHAREAGCDIVVTETGERRDDLPSSSYRNILRAGFDRGRREGELAAPGRRASRKPRDEPSPPQEAGAHQHQARHDQHRRGRPRRRARPSLPARRPRAWRRTRRRRPPSRAPGSGRRSRRSGSRRARRRSPLSGCISAKSGQSSAHWASTAGSEVKACGITPPSSQQHDGEHRAGGDREPDHPHARGERPRRGAPLRAPARR